MQARRLADRLPLILLAGWLVPGAGHFLIGHRRRGVFLFVVLLSTFSAGFALGGYRNVSLDRQPISFAAQACMGSSCAVGWYLSSTVPPPRTPPPYLALGTLYAAVASLLNMLCVLDVYERVVRMNLPEKEPAAKGAKEGQTVPEKAG